MKQALTIILLFLSLTLFAADFKLPDETIVGSVSLPPDSIVIHKDMGTFFIFQKEDLIRYQAALPQKEVEKAPDSTDKNGFLSFFTGNQWQTDFKLLYSDPKNSYINLNNDTHYLKLNPDWSLFRTDFLWLSPKLKYAGFKPQIELKHNVFNSKMIHSKASSFSVNSNFDSQNLLKYLNHTSIYSGLMFSKQNDKDTLGFSKDVSCFDLLLNGEVELPFRFSRHQLKTGLLNNEFVLESHSMLGNYIPYTDYASLYVSVNKNMLFSLDFSKKVNLSDELSFVIKNEPYTTFNSIYDQSMANLHAMISDQKYQLQVPINTSLSLKTYYYLPVSMSYQLEWRKNQRIYAYSHLSEFYMIQYRNALINSVKASTCYQYNQFTFEYEVLAMISSVSDHHSKQIPYLPHLSNTIKAKTSFYGFDNVTELSFLNLRKDSLNQKMKSAVLLGNRTHYPWKYNLNFYMNLENIFNQEYQLYSWYPKQGINLQLGLNYIF